ncbi:hypothetical protein Gotur_034354 [Gossypium turneri]
MRGLVFDIKSEILHWGVLKLGSLVVFVSKIAIHLTKLGFVDIGKPNCINNLVVPIFIVIVAVIAEMPTSTVTSAHTCFLQFSNWFMKKNGYSEREDSGWVLDSDYREGKANKKEGITAAKENGKHEIGGYYHP